MEISTEKRNLALAGLFVGIVAAVLVLAGNPGNMGFCIACFIRDTAGGFKLHSAAVVQYVRPEIIGLVLGSMIISMAKGEFRPRGGSSPVLRFVLGFFLMVGSLAFLGCPLRMILRLGGGDLNALVGLFGFTFGIFIGCQFLKRGYSLDRSYQESPMEGLAYPGIQVAALVMLVCFPALLTFSEKGPGSLHAPLVLSLVIGLLCGAAAQRTRMCTAGSIRDIILFRDTTLFMGPLFIFLAVLVMNLITGKFHLGFTGQPIAHNDHLWNFLGMTLAGLAATMLGGCPLRQLILAGEGNTDSAIAALGMLVGAAFAHNFKLAGSGGAVGQGGGVGINGRVAVVFGLVLLLVIAYVQTKKHEEEA